MKRVSWKLPYIHSIFFKKKYYLKKTVNLKIRNSCIPCYFIDKRIFIYNGIWNLSKNVTSNMIGFKFGEFSFTRRVDALLHTKKKKDKKKKII